LWTTAKNYVVVNAGELNFTEFFWPIIKSVISCCFSEVSNLSDLITTLQFI